MEGILIGRHRIHGVDGEGCEEEFWGGPEDRKGVHEGRLPASVVCFCENHFIFDKL